MLLGAWYRTTASASVVHPVDDQDGQHSAQALRNRSAAAWRLGQKRSSDLDGRCQEPQTQGRTSEFIGKMKNRPQGPMVPPSESKPKQIDAPVWGRPPEREAQGCIGGAEEMPHTSG